MRLGSFLAVLSFSSAALAHDVVDELGRVPGLRVLEEQPSSVPGYRFFVMSYTQLVDHFDPSRGTFEQLVTLMHRSTRAPTVAFTTGYDLPPYPFLDEPAEIVEGNQVNIEERFFASSTPEPSDYAELTIYQAAADHHRIIEALRAIYSGKWLSTGGSKGGMATVYHRRFFDEDIDGSVVYVAPNDVVDEVDAYDEFLANVGTPECRQSLIAAARATLERRDEIVPLLGVVTREIGLTYEYTGGLDVAFEGTATSIYWAFWQYWLEEDCAAIPPPDAPIEELAAFVSGTAGLFGASDFAVASLYAYYYQAATQLGSPDTSRLQSSFEDLLLYSGPAAMPEVADEASVASDDEPAVAAEDETSSLGFDDSAMADIDRWVKEEGHALLFIYGENDPWSAEPFEPGPGTRDSAWYTVAGGNHAASIGDLPPGERLDASNDVRRWAGLEPLEALPEAPPEALASLDPAAARAARLQRRMLTPPRFRF